MHPIKNDSTYLTPHSSTIDNDNGIVKIELDLVFFYLLKEDERLDEKRVECGDKNK